MNGMKRKAERKARERRFTDEGLPRDSKDWTEQDWATLHYGMERIKEEIAMRTTLKQETCRECKCPILVAPYEPHPDEQYATGMPAYRWDADKGEEYFVGWICETCAGNRIGEGLPGAMSGPTLHFHY